MPGRIIGQTIQWDIYYMHDYSVETFVILDWICQHIQVGLTSWLQVKQVHKCTIRILVRIPAWYKLRSIAHIWKNDAIVI